MRRTPASLSDPPPDLWDTNVIRPFKCFMCALFAWTLVSPAAPVLAEPQSAAMMSPFMENVVAGEVAKRADILRELLSRYYRLVPQDEVEAAESQANGAGCDGVEACMGEIRRILGVDVVYHLRVDDQGYVDPVHLTRLGDEGVVRQYTQCNRCTRRLYRRTIDDLLWAAHGKDNP